MAIGDRWKGLQLCSA